MGKRRRKAALGATFALLVASCASTDPNSETKLARPSASSSTVPASIQFAGETSDATFVLAERPEGRCTAGDAPAVTLFDAASGDEIWSSAIPRPAGLTIIDDDVAFVSFAWDRQQPPGIGALDIDARSPLWQRFFDDQPEQMQVVDDNLIVVSRAGIMALDAETGEDRWNTSTEFDFTEVILEDDRAYAIDNVAVHAVDLNSGQMLWQLPIDRPDELAVHGTLLAVAAGTRLIAVDTVARSGLWDREVHRLGAGDVWVSPEIVLVSLAPGESPSGGLVALDAVTGIERWRVENVDEIHRTSPTQIVTSSAATDFRGGLAYDLVAIELSRGSIEWARPMTAPAAESVLGVDANRIVASDPHPEVGGTHRVAFLNTVDGTPIWETSTDVAFDGAGIDASVLTVLYRQVDTLVEDRGHATVVLGPSRSVSIATADGIGQDPIMTPYGLLVISGERTSLCVGRELLAPT